jgi:quercetin dioxygenase-like cupin family protein
MVHTAAMRIFALSQAALAVGLIWLIASIAPSLDTTMKAEPVRVPGVFVFAALAVGLALGGWFWRRGPERPGLWLGGAVTAGVFLAAYVEVLANNVLISRDFSDFGFSLLALAGSVVALGAGIVAFREAHRSRIAVPADFRDGRVRTVGGLIATALFVFIGLWVTRRTSTQGSRGPGQGDAPPTRTPGTGVSLRTLSEGKLQMPSGQLRVSVLEVRQSQGTKMTDSHDAGFVHVLEGEQQLTIDGAAQTLRPGGAAFLGAGVTHEHSALGNVPSRWLFIGVRSRETGEKGFSFGEQTVVYQSADLPSLPGGANAEALMVMTLGPQADSLRYRTGGVTALFVLTGKVLVDAGTGATTLARSEGTQLLQGTPFMVGNLEAGESQVLAFSLVPEGTQPLVPLTSP